MIKKLLSNSLLIALLSSCSFYKPARINAPYFEEKGELNLGGSIGRTADVNLSYSPIENIGVIANYSNGFNSTKKRVDADSIERVVYKYQNYQYEIGAGPYKQFDNGWYLDAYLGYGFGQAASHVIDFGLLYDKEGYRAKFDNYFIQSTIGYKNLNYGLGGALLLKYNQLNFHNFSGSFDAPPTADYFEVDQTFVFQSNIMVDYQPNAVGYELQLGFNIAKRERYFSSRMFNIMFGINVRIDELFQKE